MQIYHYIQYSKEHIVFYMHLVGGLYSKLKQSGSHVMSVLVEVLVYIYDRTFSHSFQQVTTNAFILH